MYLKLKKSFNKSTKPMTNQETRYNLTKKKSCVKKQILANNMKTYGHQYCSERKK